MERARSALFADESSAKPLTTLDAFLLASRHYRRAALAWLERLKAVTSSDTEGVLRQIPSSCISEASIEFAQQMMVVNRIRLLASEKKLAT